MRKVHKTPGRSGVHTVLQVFAWILTIALVLCFAFLIYHMVLTNMFAKQQILLAGVIVLILAVLLGWGMLPKHRHLLARGLCMLLAIALGSCSVIAGRYLQMTNEALNFIGGGSTTDKNNNENAEILNQADLLTSKMAITVTTYAMQSSGIAQPSDLNGKLVGTVAALDPKGTEGAIQQLQSKGASFETQEFASFYELTDALFNGSVDAVIFPEQFHGELLDAANDYNQYNALTTFTNSADQYIYYEDIPEEMKNPADPVADITKDPFVVLISGSDSYGTLSTKSRSDVNMLVAVNPESHQVLILSIPRDAYMPFSCRKNETACGYAAGQMDKLTHSGIYGVGTTESSLEDFFGIEINYTVRVNFSSLINIVDAIGGIDVEVEPGLAVERFYANGTEGVHEGLNHLDGERALAFARERHAYLDGDNQRIRNQQIVLKSLMRSMMSPSMIVNYPAFLRALSTAFSTNMPADQIRDLIRLEITSFPHWDIQSYALTGDPTTAFSAALGTNASVSIVPEDQIAYAKQLFEKIGAAQTIDLSDAPASSAQTGTIPDQSQKPADVYEEQEIQITVPDAGWTPPADNPYVPPEQPITPIDPVQPDPGTQPDPAEPSDPSDPVQPDPDPVPEDPGTEYGG